MEQMIASWSMVMVHGLMVADSVLCSKLSEIVGSVGRARRASWGLEQCSRRAQPGYLARPTTEAPETQIYFINHRSGAFPVPSDALLVAPRRTGKSVDRE